MAGGRCSRFIYSFIRAAFCLVGHEKVFAINQAKERGALRLITPHGADVDNGGSVTSLSGW
jgi:hypothetical protein